LVADAQRSNLEMGAGDHTYSQPRPQLNETERRISMYVNQIAVARVGLALNGHCQAVVHAAVAWLGFLACLLEVGGCWPVVVRLISAHLSLLLVVLFGWGAFRIFFGQNTVEFNGSICV
jgi:TPP-dependent indolepyruvate ferredoxin oxidoreductase alpha subunit